jgi:hypothetical protein
LGKLPFVPWNPHDIMLAARVLVTSPFRVREMILKKDHDDHVLEKTGHHDKSKQNN